MGEELLIVMEYVHGDSLAALFRSCRVMGAPIEPRVIGNVIAAALHGLHAAHDAVSDDGTPLGIVHRDVSPHNVLVGVDGVARVLDFGVAKAVGQLHTTRQGDLKGKVAYMAPEQLTGDRVTRRTDLFGAAAILWEGLTGARLFGGTNDPEIALKILSSSPAAPSTVRRGLPAGLDEIVLRGLEKDPEKRFATAREMAEAIEAAVGLAPPREIGAWVEEMAPERLAAKAARIAEIERSRAVAIAGEAGPPDPTPEVATGSIAALVRIFHGREAGPRSRVATLGAALALVAFGALAVRLWPRGSDAGELGATPTASVPSLAAPASTPSAAPSAEPPASAAATGSDASEPPEASAPPAASRPPTRPVRGGPRPRSSGNPLYSRH
jgi:serine/threonine-protein kinase